MDEKLCANCLDVEFDANFKDGICLECQAELRSLGLYYGSEWND